jgi:hypothetical protein
MRLLAPRLRAVLDLASRPAGVFLIAFALSVTVAFVRQRTLFTVVDYPWSDQSVNGLSVLHAEHFQQLVGNYSRVGFRHPGPALFYMLAAGEVLFHQVLRVAAGPYNGQVLMVSVYVSLGVALSTLVLYRATRSRGAAALTFALTFFFVARNGLFGLDWFPNLYMTAFLVFVVSAAAVAAGYTRELPIYAAASGTLVHGHVSFILFVAVTTLCASALWLHRYRGGWRTELDAHRRGWLGASAILALFLLPLVLDLLLHFPGQWPSYAHYVLHGEHDPRSAAQVWDFFAHFWKATGFTAVVPVLALVLGVGLAGTDPRRERRRFLLVAYLVLALQSLLTLYYLVRGVDRLELSYVYVAYFYATVPALVVVLAATQLWMRSREAVLRPPHVPRAVPAVVVAVIVVVLTGVTARLPQIAVYPGIGPTYSRAAEVLQTIPEANGRTLVLINDQYEYWRVIASVAVQLQRDGVAWCAPDRGSAAGVFHDDELCAQDLPPQRRFVVHFTSGQPPAGARVLWRSGPNVPQPVVAYAV